VIEGLITWRKLKEMTGDVRTVSLAFEVDHLKA
jgi:hypothetical protein